MIQSTRRILTTHTGSLPRPDRLLALMTAKEAGQPAYLLDLADLYDLRTDYPRAAECYRKVLAQVAGTR